MEYRMVNLGTLIKKSANVRCGDNRYPVLSMTMHDGLIFQDNKFKKVIASKDRSDYKVVYRNQLVIGFPIDEGVLAAQRVTDVGIVSPAYTIWSVNQAQIIPEFLEYALRCERSIQYYKANLRGSTARRRSLPTTTLLEHMIPLPEKKEQERILNIIHNMKNVIAYRKKEIKALDDLVRSRFVEMFGDLNLNDKKWDREPLGKLCTIVRGGSPRPIEQFLGGDVPWIKIGDATDGDNVYLTSTKEHIIQEGVKKSRLVKAGSLIFANCGVSLGFARILTFDGCIHDGWLAMEDIDARLDKVFLLQSLNQMTEHFRSIAPAGTQPNLNTTIMKCYQQIMPPIELQREFIRFAKQVDKSKVAVQKIFKISHFNDII